MYTQCPECEVAFRITAEVLQQARGQVRCGSCGSAFNALDHLHEEPPASGAASDGERTAESDGELLDALDKMAGPEEVRIQDTGVEWLVLEDTEDANEPVEGSWNAKEGEQSPDGADTDLDTAETSEQPALDEQAALHFGGVPPDEIRYDDNTPLPDDFGEETSTPAPVPARRSTDNIEPPSEAEEAQALLELSEPDEWEDLLEEVDTSRSQGTDSDAGDLPLEIEEELVAIHEELATLPDSLPDTGAPPEDAGAPTSTAPDQSGTAAPEVPEESSEPEVEISLEPEAVAEADSIAAGEEPADGGVPSLADAGEEADSPPQADAELSPDDVARLEDEDESFTSTEVPVEVDQSELLDADDLERLADAEPEQKTGTDQEAETEAAADAEKTQREKEPEAPEATAAPSDEADEADEAQPEAEAPEPAIEAEPPDPQLASDEESMPTDEAESSGEFERAIRSAEDEILAEREEQDDGDEDDTPQPAADVDSDIASVTAIMQIDDELLRAMQDENLAAALAGEDGEPVVETIVMEGDVVRGMLEEAEADGEPKPPPSREAVGDPASLIDTYMMSRAEERQPFSLGKKTMGGIVALLLLGLAAQYVHSTREHLATFAFFNQTIGPVYRMFGHPVTPAWDIKGWQFEATSGSTDVDDAVLTISSRISNRSNQALPYPLVHVSLTDRYEEIIGSRVLEPNEYLAGDGDASQPVPAGENFTATITIASPSADATGFKLNVCYRDGPGRVRCAIEDFKAP